MVDVGFWGRMVPATRSKHSDDIPNPEIRHILLQGKAMVDVGFWGGMVPANSHNASELRAMLDAGALGFKSFLSPSGDQGSGR
jgi:dihydroorotase-like cyclic amidohydrolase